MFLLYFLKVVSLYKFHLVNILLLVAIVALDNAVFLVYHMEDGLHRFVVCDTLGVVALYYALDNIRSSDWFLLHHLIVADDVKHHVRGNDGETGNLLIGEELVLHLYDTLLS